MYNIVAILIAFALNIVSSASFAQEFTFKPPPSPSAPVRQSAYSAEDFANSTTRAYQEQQAKVAAIADKQAKEAQMNKAAAMAKQAQGTAGKPPASQEQVITAPQKTMTQESSTTAPKPVPVEAPPTPSPAAPPYTGFQSPPKTPSSGGSYNSGSTPSNNNQNSGGWGSSIKY
jgi:hypothetical protein